MTHANMWQVIKPNCLWEIVSVLTLFPSSWVCRLKQVKIICNNFLKVTLNQLFEVIDKGTSWRKLEGVGGTRVSIDILRIRRLVCRRKVRADWKNKNELSFVQIIVYRGHGTPNCHSWGWGSRLGAGWIRTGCGGRSGVLAASVSGHSYANQDNQVEGDDDQKSEKVGVHICPK